jgi:hypothetical protein
LVLPHNRSPVLIEVLLKDLIGFIGAQLEIPSDSDNVGFTGFGGAAL